VFGFSFNHPICLCVKQVFYLQKFRAFAQQSANSAGQAVVEYMLVLVVTLTILGMVKSVFSAVDEFMYSYMGEYISCLMDYGELPAMGTDNSELSKSKDGGSTGGKKCNNEFAGFTLSNGRPANGNRGGSGNSSGRGSTGKSSQSATSESKSNTEKTAADDKNSSSSSNRNLDDKSSTSQYAKGRIKRSTSGDDYRTADNGSQGADDKVRIIATEEGEDGANGRGGSVRSTNIVYEKSRYKPISGAMAKELDKRASLKRAPSSRILQTAAGDEYRFGPRKSILPPPEYKAPPVTEDDNSGFQFGYFLKWLLIIGMCIAIFIFFGGQIMSFMNSQEK